MNDQLGLVGQEKLMIVVPGLGAELFLNSSPLELHAFKQSVPHLLAAINDSLSFFRSFDIIYFFTIIVR